MCAVYPRFTVSDDSNKINFRSFVHFKREFTNFIFTLSCPAFLTTSFSQNAVIVVIGSGLCIYLIQTFTFSLLLSVLVMSVYCFLFT